MNVIDKEEFFILIHLINSLLDFQGEAGPKGDKGDPGSSYDFLAKAKVISTLFCSFY